MGFVYSNLELLIVSLTKSSYVVLSGCWHKRTIVFISYKDTPWSKRKKHNQNANLKTATMKILNWCPQASAYLFSKTTKFIKRIKYIVDMYSNKIQDKIFSNIPHTLFGASDNKS